MSTLAAMKELRAESFLIYSWGNVRRFPTADERNRTGGAGVYYHVSSLPHSSKGCSEVTVEV